MLGINKKGTLA